MNRIFVRISKDEKEFFIFEKLVKADERIHTVLMDGQFMKLDSYTTPRPSDMRNSAERWSLTVGLGKCLGCNCMFCLSSLVSSMR